MKIFGTDLNDISQFDNLTIEQLDIRDTKFTRLKALNNFKNLKKLIITKNAFEAKELNLIPEHIEVIIVDN